MHGMCAWRSGIPPERVLSTWPQSQTLGKRTRAPAKQQPKQQVVRRDDAAVRVSFRRLLDDIGCAASSRVVHALLGQFASHWAQRCVSSQWSPPCAQSAAASAPKPLNGRYSLSVSGYPTSKCSQSGPSSAIHTLSDCEIPAVVDHTAPGKPAPKSDTHGPRCWDGDS
jgi:hypothetical protein